MKRRNEITGRGEPKNDIACSLKIWVLIGKGYGDVNFEQLAKASFSNPVTDNISN